MRKHRFALAVTAALALVLSSCVSTESVYDEDPAVDSGIVAWNSNRGPSSAQAYWEEIEDDAKRAKYLNYIKIYNDGVAALGKSDANGALNKFTQLDKHLVLPADVCLKGADLTAVRIDRLLGQSKVNDASKLHSQAVSRYGDHESLTKASNEIKLVKQILAKKSALQDEVNKVDSIEDFDDKTAALDSILVKFNSESVAVDNLVKNSPVGNEPGVTPHVKNFKTFKQDIAIARESAVREKVYSYKELIGEEFARQPEGKGTGKNGTYTNEDILAHYKSVQTNIDTIYNELVAFSEKHGKDVDPAIVEEIKLQKNDLNSKIAQVNREIANAKEIASRGKTVMPLMIGLFNADPSSSKDNKKSRPAKFSATGVKGDEYWWGMVSIPKGQMNDLVITLKDNRNVRVFNKNTKSGKLIEKENIKDLVSRSSRVGNSWPVLNAGEQLNGSNYYFEIQKGKTDSYQGEVVVYSSFITRMR